MVRLFGANMKATLTHIAVNYSEGIQKSISEHTCGTLKHNVRLSHQVALQSAANRKLKLQFAQGPETRHKKTGKALPGLIGLKQS